MWPSNPERARQGAFDLRKLSMITAAARDFLAA